MSNACTYRHHNQHNHQSTLGDRALLLVGILRQEEQSREADLLYIQPNEDMLDSFREEYATGVSRSWLI